MLNTQAQHPFIFSDGTQVLTLQDLVNKLKTLDQYAFQEFVNDAKHDFANWILQSHQEDHLGNFILNIKSRELLIAALQDFIDHNSAGQNNKRIQMQSQTSNQFQPQANQNTQQTNQYQPQQQTANQFQQPTQQQDFMPPQQQSQPAQQDYKPQPMQQQESYQPPQDPGYAANQTDQNSAQSYMPQQQNNQPQQQNQQPVQEQPQAPQQEQSPDQFKPSPQETQEAQQKKAQEEKKEEQKPPEKQDAGTDNSASMSNLEFVEKVEEDPLVTEEEVAEFAHQLQEMRTQISKVFIGQEETVHMVVIALLCEAHLLLEGVPGLAKSVLVETLARTVEGTKFSRIQFLPDLLPADVIGGQIYNPKTGEFTTVKGPIFGNFILADEINRAPPKTHAALMEAMAERKINIDKEEFILERPFLVMATQNPLENKGTYELPEAVMDRFMFKVDMDYPKRHHEKIIITENNTTKGQLRKTVKPVVNKDQVLLMQRKVKTIHISDRIKEFILDIVQATRGENKKIEGIKFVKYGAGPRASIALGIAAKAQAMMEGRNYVLPKDINTVSKSILRHRVSLNFKGKAYQIKSDRIVDEILEKTALM